MSRVETGLQACSAVARWRASRARRPEGAYGPADQTGEPWKVEVLAHCLVGRAPAGAVSLAARPSQPEDASAEMGSRRPAELRVVESAAVPAVTHCLEWRSNAGAAAPVRGPTAGFRDPAAEDYRVSRRPDARRGRQPLSVSVSVSVQVPDPLLVRLLPAVRVRERHALRVRVPQVTLLMKVPPSCWRSACL
jgi:hypothetical protein